MQHCKLQVLSTYSYYAFETLSFRSSCDQVYDCDRDPGPPHIIHAIDLIILKVL